MDIKENTGDTAPNVPKIVVTIILWLSLFVLTIGDLHWIWMAIQRRSFWMIVLAITPLVAITGTVGAWSLCFGEPDWVVEMFG